MHMDNTENKLLPFIKCYLDEGASLPIRAHESDAGLDLYSPERVILYPGESAVIDTGVHLQIPEGYCGITKSRSGLNFNEDIITVDGVIDSGYTGSIKVKLWNIGKRARQIDANQKISQLIIIPVWLPNILWVDPEEFVTTQRGGNGFGSTGK